MDRVVCRVTITGRVQGVGFRYAFADQARALSLDGWVANRRNGDVEAVVAGSQGDVDAIIAWARRGPPAALVTRVETAPASGAFDDFQIIATF